MERISNGLEKSEFSKQKLRLEERMTELYKMIKFDLIQSMDVSPLRSELFDRMRAAIDKLGYLSVNAGHVSDERFPEKGEKDWGLKKNNHPLSGTHLTIKEIMKDFDEDTSLRAQLERTGSMTDLGRIENEFKEIETQIDEIIMLASQKEAA